MIFATILILNIKSQETIKYTTIDISSFQLHFFLLLFLL